MLEMLELRSTNSTFCVIIPVTHNLGKCTVFLTVYRNLNAHRASHFDLRHSLTVCFALEQLAADCLGFPVELL